MRKWDAEVGDDLRRELEVSKECSYQASRNSKCALEKSKKLAAERLQLLDDKLQLAREVTALKGAIASEAKKYVRLPHHAPAPRTVLTTHRAFLTCSTIISGAELVYSMTKLPKLTACP